MTEGQQVWWAHVGTEAGSMADVRPAWIVKRTPSAWTYSFKEDGGKYWATFRCADTNAHQKLFETEIEAYDWLLTTLKRRVKSAEDVLKYRMEVLKKFEAKRSQAKDQSQP